MCVPIQTETNLTPSPSCLSADKLLAGVLGGCSLANLYSFQTVNGRWLYHEGKGLSFLKTISQLFSSRTYRFAGEGREGMLYESGHAGSLWWFFVLNSKLEDEREGFCLVPNARHLSESELLQWSKDWLEDVKAEGLYTLP